MSARILVVEDDPDVAMIVADLLAAEGHQVDTASDGNAGLARAMAEEYNLLVLDVMMPGMDGFAVCDAVRQRGFDGGILMLTARGQLEDRVQGLLTGADDYLVKPFEPLELVARVTALLRRVRKGDLTPVMRFEFGSVVADFARPEVRRNGERVSLTTKEMHLLRCLVDSRGQVVTRDQLLSRVWKSQPFITPRTVDVHIAWLRQKLEEEPQTPRHIITVRGEGYRFER